MSTLDEMTVLYQRIGKLVVSSKKPASIGDILGNPNQIRLRVVGPASREDAEKQFFILRELSGKESPLTKDSKHFYQVEFLD